MTPSESNLQRAQRAVAAAMTACLGFWFAPVASGLICNAAEAVLIDDILRIFGCHSEGTTRRIFWAFRKKMLLLNVGTYIPVAGVPLQLFETYAMGQFAIHCASQPDRLRDETWMAIQWRNIETEIFSGYRVVQFYEQATGTQFPEYAREKFVQSVDQLANLYRKTPQIPDIDELRERYEPRLRQQATNALGIASDKMKKLAEYMEAEKKKG